MPVVTSGAKLVNLLKGTGTGKDKLDVCRRVLFDAKTTDTPASAEDVVDALVDKFGPHHATVAKAKELQATGAHTGPKVALVSEPEDEMVAEEEKATEVAKKTKKDA